jgi:hypothetical protein
MERKVEHTACAVEQSDAKIKYLQDRLTESSKKVHIKMFIQHNTKSQTPTSTSVNL